MEKKYGFTKMDIAACESWVAGLQVARTIKLLQQHHTYSPDYSLFTGNNHFDLQRNMKRYHVNHNGWADIGQHFTVFPDGLILTGRNPEQPPACIYGQNARAICIENLGNFDRGGDIMHPRQEEAILRLTAALCKRFAIPANTDHIVYHHWFDLRTGERNNGSGHNKSCPGSYFFKGNKVEDCQRHFLPKVLELMLQQEVPGAVAPMMYVCVTANRLNIREQPNIRAPRVSNRAPASLGAVLRVYETANGWHKISYSSSHWVSANYAIQVQPAVVTASELNIRNAPDISGLRTGSLVQGQEIFVHEERNGWCRIGMDSQWVSKSFLSYR